MIKYRINNDGHGRSFSNIIGDDDAILDEFVLRLKFRYNDNQVFHKLSKHLCQTNDFSLFYTNICLLSVNLENLETLISDLERNFYRYSHV